MFLGRYKGIFVIYIFPSAS